jgi:signal transduction histidine kinase
MLFHWSVRYFLVLLLSFVIVTAVTIFGFHLDARSEQRHAMASAVRELAQTIGTYGSELPEGPVLGRLLDGLVQTYDLSNRSYAVILDENGRTVRQYPEYAPDEAAQLPARMREAMGGKPRLLLLEPIRGREPYLAAVHPIREGDGRSGYALYMEPRVNLLRDFLQVRRQPYRVILMLTLMLSGYALVYAMTRRLVRPIREAADAAKQVIEGNYRVKLNADHEEEEIHELMASFGEMADRLRTLESLRTQLLAGVTHELRTPVTSISGLIQAVQDGVVGGEEAGQFLEICREECRKLERMVEDLLEFNRFSAGMIAIKPEPLDLLAAVTEITAKWRLSHKPEGVEIRIIADEQADWRMNTDRGRLEQTLVNLLNNALAALRPNGELRIRLNADPAAFRIQVEDTGLGIPAEEQPFVFEPFYRGKEKKMRVRGLGLGLPFSRLIARSLGGDLLLTHSGPEGTAFTLVLPAPQPVEPGS